MAQFVYFGDSFIRRLRDDRKKYSQSGEPTMAQHSVHWVCKDGLQAHHITEEWIEQVFPGGHIPQMVIIHLGGNDLDLGQRPPLQVMEDLRRIVQQLKARGVEKVQLVEPPYRSTKTLYYSVWRDSLAKMMRRGFKKEYVIMKSVRLQHYLSDGVHLNAKGMKNYYFIMLKALRR